MLIGILSDAHGNVEAFRLGLKVLARAGTDVTYFLGDAVGYIPDAGVVGLLRESKIKSIRGNHDDLLVRRCTSADKEAVYRHHEVFESLGAKDRQFLEALPLRLELHDKDFKGLFVHGSPADALTGYVYPDTDLSAFSDVDADVIFMGHTHRPFVREYQQKLFVNVGSCGLPRGEDLRGSVCTFDTRDRAAQIVRYDISTCCKSVLSKYSLAPTVTSLLSRCAGFRGGQLEK